MTLKSFYGKHVTIKTHNGLVYNGDIDEYFFPDDNDNGEESIILKTNNNDLVEFTPNDILEIEIN